MIDCFRPDKKLADQGMILNPYPHNIKGQSGRVVEAAGNNPPERLNASLSAGTPCPSENWLSPGVYPEKTLLIPTSSIKHCWQIIRWT
jgi:hypothetical protein